METYLSNRFNDILYDDQTSILYHIVKPATSEMVEEDFKSMLIKWKAFAFNTPAKFFLIDTCKLEFAVSPDLQVWITEQITGPVIAAKQVNKICFVMPEEFVSKLSMNQYIEEADRVSQGTQVKYVSDRAKAEEWLQ